MQLPQAYNNSRIFWYHHHHQKKRGKIHSTQQKKKIDQYIFLSGHTTRDLMAIIIALATGEKASEDGTLMLVWCAVLVDIMKKNDY